MKTTLQHGTITIIDPDGTVSRRDVERPSTVAELQRIVGGYIELVPLWNTFEGERCLVFCDEEGRLRQKPFNRIATMLWRQTVIEQGKPLRPDFNDATILVGSVVILTGVARDLR